MDRSKGKHLQSEACMIIKIKPQKPRNPFGKFRNEEKRKAGKHIISQRRQEKRERLYREN